MGKRRIVSILSVLIFLILALAMAGPGQAAAPAGPLKIGWIADLTGTAAAIGKDMSNGVKMYMEEAGSQFAGRKVEIIMEDGQGRPEVSLTKLRKLVESDRVHVVAGVLFAHISERPRVAALLPLAWFVALVLVALVVAALIGPQPC